MPVQYAGIVEEHRAVRTKAGLFDVSHMGEIELRGEHAAAVVDYLVTGEAAALADGRALYTCACNERGTILDDLIVYRVARDVFLVVCNAGNRDKISAHFRKAAENHCEFEDRSDDIALLALTGTQEPSRSSASRAKTPPRARSSGFQFRDAVVANVHATVARTGYTGEDGVEIFCSATDAPHLWRTIIELGSGRGLEPTGLGARDTLRLEARLALYGNDIDETTNPLEAALGWVVKLNKPMFIGKEAIHAIARGLTRKLVGFS
jgi:aminomethyltransferase